MMRNAVLSERPRRRGRIARTPPHARGRLCQKTLLAHPWSVAALELPVRTASKDVRRAAVCVVARIAQKLIIETQPRGGRDGVAVIGLENRLGPIVGQLPVADQDAEAAGVEERDVSVADTVDDAGNPDRIIGAAPGFSIDRNAA